MAMRLLLLGVVLLIAGCEQAGYSHPVSRQAVLEQSQQTAQADAFAQAEQDGSSQPAEPAATESNPPAAEVKEPEPPTPYVNDGSTNPERKELPIKTITFDDFKFDIQKDSKFYPSMLTPKIEEMVGRKVRVRGFILPTPQQTIRNFVLTRDNLTCCFGPGAAIYDCVQVATVPDVTAQYTTRVVTVEGMLTLREVLDFDGITRAIYHLDATSVK